MLEGAMLIWFVLTGVSLLLLVIDLVGNSPVSWVQKLAWFLVVCYTGPIGLIAYLYACRRPFKGGHDAATKAWWKQGINSEVHCLAGDATGIIIAASIVPAFVITNGWGHRHRICRRIYLRIVHLPSTDDDQDVQWQLLHGCSQDLFCRSRVDELRDGRHDPHDGLARSGVAGVHGTNCVGLLVQNESCLDRGWHSCIPNQRVVGAQETQAWVHDLARG